MQIALHISFLESLGRLSSTDRRQTELLIGRLSEHGTIPGMRPHTLSGDAAGILSLSPNMDLRVLAVVDGDVVTLVHVDHHDDAYRWARRNGAVLRATGVVRISSDLAMREDPSADSTPPGFGSELVSKLLEAGVPKPIADLLSPSVDEDELLERMSMLAAEWQELILETLDGPASTLPSGLPSNVWVAPNDVALQQALALPEAHWRVFLHPTQRDVVAAGVENDVVVVGGPGTGKSVALVHRARRLAEGLGRGECVVVVGHSPSAARDLEAMVRLLCGDVPRNIHVVDMVAIGRRGRPRASDVLSAKGGPYLQHQGEDVLALLIDEGQDIHRTTKPYILGSRPKIRTHVSMAIDPNQNLFADNRRDERFLAYLARAHAFPLTYSYRIPREAGLAGLQLLDGIAPPDDPEVFSAMRRQARTISFGFASDLVAVHSYESIAQGIRAAGRQLETLGADRGERVAVIFCGSRNHRQAFAGELRILGYDPEKDRGLHTPRSVKGAEFEHCIIVAPELLMEHDRDDFARHAVYVALSRCRRGVSVYAHHSFAPALTVPGTTLHEVPAD